MGLFDKLFGTHSQREMKGIDPIVNKIEALAGEYAAKTDEQLRAKTAELQQRCRDGESLDDLLPEAFANCREAARLMSAQQVRRLPVVEEGKVVGMLSLGDLAKCHRFDMEAAQALSEISENIVRR